MGVIRQSTAWNIVFSLDFLSILGCWFSHSVLLSLPIYACNLKTPVSSLILTKDSTSQANNKEKLAVRTAQWSHILRILAV